VRSEFIEDFEEYCHHLKKRVQEIESPPISYTIHRSEKDNCQFIFVQLFADRDALEAHMTAAFMDEARERLRTFYVATPAVEICQVLEETDA
tara:strand:- start:4474 stop:4749 length:276 start_codon:yes stop_codon:yes gene_type:complete